MNTREVFFTKEKTFYRTLFPLLLTIALQNLVAYSVNMADNISYFPSSSPIQYCCPPKIGSSFPSLGPVAASFVWKTTLSLPFSYAHIPS